MVGKKNKMGVTIGNKEKSIDMGCGGFYNLRKTIAGLLSEEFRNLYEEWTSMNGSINDEEGNRLLDNLYKRGILTNDDDVIIDFLFASYCDGKLSVKGCKRLWKLIKDYDDNIVYGYIGRPDRAMFKDFKEIIKTSAENRWIMKWR